VGERRDRDHHLFFCGLYPGASQPEYPTGPVPLFLDSLPILLFPLLLFSFLQLDDEYLGAVVRFLLSTSTWLATVRGLWLLAWFLAGKGSHAFYKVNATLSEGDVLYFYAFLQLILLGVYIALKEPKYLIASLILFLVIKGIRRDKGRRIGIRTRFWGSAVARGCDCVPAARLPQNMDWHFATIHSQPAAPASELVNKNPSAQTRFRRFSDSPLHIEPKGLQIYTSSGYNGSVR